MIVTTYHKTVPNGKNQEKIDLLRFFSQGVATAGDTAVDSNDYVYRPSDVAVIQGWVNIGSKTGQHLTLRNTVVNNQLNNRRHVVVADSNLFLYSNTSSNYGIIMRQKETIMFIFYFYLIILYSKVYYLKKNI